MFIADDAFSNCYDEFYFKGYAGTYAESYAAEHNILFVPLDQDELVTTGDTTTTTEEALAKIKGDVNQNGEIDIADAVLLVRYVHEDSDLNAFGLDFSSSDLNDDKLYDLNDVGILLMWLSDPAAI